MAGIYIHIPFCKSRCIYCGFYSQTSLSLRQRYVNALCREMEIRAHQKEYAGWSINTVYLGGGTPSQLTAHQLRQLFNHINKVYGLALSDAHHHHLEVTIECNPDDVTDAFADALRSLPVNRVSMGVQSFSDERLRFLHRRHNATQVVQAIERLRSAGIDNISIDLIYGFPNETMEQWQADVDAAIALKVEHLSAYALQYEEGTPLYAMMKRGEVHEIDEELSRRMYYMLKDQLADAGYEHYEISNFALPGRRSRHNGSYWNQTPYIGLGAAAHSFDGRDRQWNVSDIQRYIEGMENGNSVAEKENLTDDNRYNEQVMTALRTCEGLSLSSLSSQYRDYCLLQAKPYLDGALLTIADDHLRLTRNGLFVSDMVISDLMMV